TIVGEPRGGAVVHHEAVLAQHDSVTRLADRKRRECIDVEPIEQRARVRAMDVDLAEGRDVADPAAFTGHRSPRVYVLQPIAFSRPCEPLRALPQARIDESGALFDRPLVAGGA